MIRYAIPMVPGPVSVPETVLNAYAQNYGSADLEPEFLSLYNHTETQLKKLLGTQNQVVIKTGEGMVALWGALKSCLQPGDRVLAVASGVFGYGIGEMAKKLGAQVKTVGFAYNETYHDWKMIEETISEFQPKMITAVHCETPSGTLNPLEKLGEIKKRQEVPLLYVDVVASVGGTPVLSDEWQIDLALGGSQKVLSAPPEMSFLSVSPKAWEIIESVGYIGYDALLPFRSAQKEHYFPYTPSWHGVAALNAAADLILTEGLEATFDRHARTAAFTQERIQAMGLELFAVKDAIKSPTVTAVKVPERFRWADLNTRFREKGLVVGGSYGPLADKVFRLGHMGNQARMELVQQALEVIQQVL
jgi:aspartate aminotransferase-like enzyme